MSSRTSGHASYTMAAIGADHTVADERAVVQKESAAIRASFREESHNSDLRYVTSRAYTKASMR